MFVVFQITPFVFFFLLFLFLLFSDVVSLNLFSLFFPHVAGSVWLQLCQNCELFCMSLVTFFKQLWLPDTCHLEPCTQWKLNVVFKSHHHLLYQMGPKCIRLHAETFCHHAYNLSQDYVPLQANYFHMNLYLKLLCAKSEFSGNSCSNDIDN